MDDDSRVIRRLDEIIALLNAWQIPAELAGIVETTSDARRAFRLLTAIRPFRVGKGSAWQRYVDGALAGVREARFDEYR